MPRKNKRKVYVSHDAIAINGNKIKKKCYQCVLAGASFVCLSRDGTCVKEKQGVVRAARQGSD